jgi:hypothetical protein
LSRFFFFLRGSGKDFSFKAARLFFAESTSEESPELGILLDLLLDESGVDHPCFVSARVA